MDVTSTVSGRGGYGGVFIFLLFARQFTIIYGQGLFESLPIGFVPLMNILIVYALGAMLLKENPATVKTITGHTFDRPFSSIILGLVLIVFGLLLVPVISKIMWDGTVLLLETARATQFVPLYAALVFLSVLLITLGGALFIYVILWLLIAPILGYLTIARVFARNDSWRLGLAIAALLAGVASFLGPVHGYLEMLFIAILTGSIGAAYIAELVAPRFDNFLEGMVSGS